MPVSHNGCTHVVYTLFGSDLINIASLVVVTHSYSHNIIQDLHRDKHLKLPIAEHPVMCWELKFKPSPFSSNLPGTQIKDSHCLPNMPLLPVITHNTLVHSFQTSPPNIYQQHCVLPRRMRFTLFDVCVHTQLYAQTQSLKLW